MNGFQANPEELIAKGNRINTISNNYFDEKSKIYSTGEKIATAWQGADSSNYLNKLKDHFIVKGGGNKEAIQGSVIASEEQIRKIMEEENEL